MAEKVDKSRRRAHGANGRKRTNRTGTLERRGERWIARWYVPTPDGGRVRMSQTLAAATLKEARAELAALTEGNALMTRERILRRKLDELDAVRAELRRIEESRPALRLDDAWEAYTRSPERPQSGAATLAQYGAQYARFAAWMARRRPDVSEVRGVTRAMAAEYLAELSAAVSPNTYNKHASLLRLVWRTLGAEARCAVNPWEGVRRRVQPRTNGRRALTVEELQRVTANLMGEMRLLFALGIYTGLRLGDCALMDWGAVDLARSVIVTKPRKTARTGRTVEIPIHPALAAVLAETPQERRTGCLMPRTAADYGRDTGSLARRIRRVFEAAGIETARRVEGYAKPVAVVGFHSLRHTFVSLMGNAGAPLALVQSIVGHSNPMMTAHYFHARTDALARTVSTIPAILQPVQIARVEARPKCLQIAEI